MRLPQRALAQILAALVALAVLASGCGSADDSSRERSAAPERTPTATATTPEAPPGASAQTCEDTANGAEQLRVTGTGCDVGRGVVAAWTNQPSCSPGNEASRVSCDVRDGYRCLGAAAGRGIAVSCARPGSSISFLSKRG
jgi:hypothetical protein